MAYDLILVGTGFASTFFLKRYLEKSIKPKKILILERGEFFPHRERLKKMRERKYGKTSFFSALKDPGNLYINHNKEKLWIFDPNFGGSSNCWTGCTPRFFPDDFQLKSKYGVGADWPVTYEELEPYYCEAEEIMQISGPSKTPYPMSKAYPLPPHSLSTTDRLLHKRYEELYISQPTARASRAIGNRGKCCSSGICHLCPVEAKFTIENGMMYTYDKSEIEIIYNAQVHQLNTQNNLVKSVIYHQNGKDISIDGEIVALGANAIYNAHILLNSNDKNTWTGKGLSEQVGIYAYIYLKDLANNGGGSIISANGFMMYNGDFRSERAGCLIENHNDLFLRAEPGKWRDIMKLKFIFEDLPSDNNHISTSENPLLPEIHYQGYSEYVNRSLERLPKSIEEQFSSVLPVEKIEIASNPEPTEAHILGTTRMSYKASDGVVDKELIHHHFRNLFILGGSVFPTNSPANPTLTLSALSLMAADKAS